MQSFPSQQLFLSVGGLTSWGGKSSPVAKGPVLGPAGENWVKTHSKVSSGRFEFHSQGRGHLRRSATDETGRRFFGRGRRVPGREVVLEPQVPQPSRAVRVQLGTRSPS